MVTEISFIAMIIRNEMSQKTKSCKIVDERYTLIGK